MRGKMCRICRIALLGGAISAALLVGFAPPVEAGHVTPVSPTLIDRGRGFVYFTLYNGWSEPITRLFGKVYGYGRPDLKTPALLNNPDQAGMKVSFGEHLPGSYAMYRFKIPTGWAVFPRYALEVREENYFTKRVYR